ncbi:MULTISPECIES: tRNA-binding protein [Leeuwenhoekiella]|jgi:tRNA-binding protein|uniref:CsaA, csaA protein n=1 Tax=Leeuwenhoekiella blandensis (strain CECT 7118 / CCUG 51940 / KCTC 22103 / MED217) TaxID=398720 RepID=A3XG30_LEEBM|nr:tRNA-binding protein [Leeuwenhoekiella blandensis]EAQ50919.1 CsaA, csaA protein [Leeuwenhoekiella blandensis MED217]MBQ52297.1 tRNA-binding protein [Leeuwenhoekiella sp.]|tara:strand:- start:547 stop:885 length:339 start_codon:yes stop_codon:yes gene_type:complete
MNNDLKWSEFARVDMRVGTIISVSDFPEARKPAFQLHIDFGEELGVRKTSAQITKKYERQELVGKQVIAVVNFPKKQIANFMSECLLLGAVDGEEVTLLNPDLPVPNGVRIS